VRLTASKGQSGGTSVNQKIRVTQIRFTPGIPSWWWYCPIHKAGLPCSSWKKAMMWACTHARTMPQKEGAQ
jgi:hypothetical protein